VSLCDDLAVQTHLADAARECSLAEIYDDVGCGLTFFYGNGDKLKGIANLGIGGFIAFYAKAGNGSLQACVISLVFDHITDLEQEKRDPMHEEICHLREKVFKLEKMIEEMKDKQEK
jgi:hypothetical protein